MTTNTCELKIGPVDALVIRKPIKNLHLAVLPPNGKVRVSAPLSMKDDTIRTLLATRLVWIKKQQEKFKSQERQTPRVYVSGESHYFWGIRYRLEVVHGDMPANVRLMGKDKIILTVRPKSDQTKREQVMMDWYRNELRTVASSLLDLWQATMGVNVNEWGIKRMKTRWGTCNPRAGRIWLNLELAKKPQHFLDYIIVHELTHLLEKKHNARFKSYMDTYIPHWRHHKEELNRTILSHENWG